MTNQAKSRVGQLLRIKPKATGIMFRSHWSAVAQSPSTWISTSRCTYLGPQLRRNCSLGCVRNCTTAVSVPIAQQLKAKKNPFVTSMVVASDRRQCRKCEQVLHRSRQRLLVQVVALVTAT